MDKKCAFCGTVENIQTHHISYDPEITEDLCVDCHKNLHNHGVGSAEGKGGASIFNLIRDDIFMLLDAGAPNTEIAKLCNASPITVGYWREKLGIVREKITRGHNRYIHDDYEKAITFLGKDVPQYINIAIEEKLEIDIFKFGCGTVKEFIEAKKREMEEDNEAVVK